MPFIDARSLPGGSEIVADVLVIGAGMAGLTIARELAGTGQRIALLESGGQTFDAAVQDLAAGSGVMRGPDNPDRNFDDYLLASRRRMLGGAGNIWGGKCVALDPADFAERAWAPGSGWPVSRAQIQPWYDRACDLLAIPHFGPGGESPTNPPHPVLKIDAEREFFSAQRHFSRFSGAVDAKAFDGWRTAPAQAANVTVYLNANVVELKLAADRKGLERLDLAGLDGKRMTAKAKTYILAAGGIENARLLLASNSVETAGVGNRADLVGRYFQGHVTYSADDRAKGRTSGVYLSGTDQEMKLYTIDAWGQSHCVFAPTLAGQKARKAGNCTVTLNAFSKAAPPDPELAALQQLAEGVDSARSAPRSDRDLSCFFMSEHHPNPQSRVTLGPTSDALGMPRARLEWTWSKADWDSLESSVAAFSQALGASGLGRARFPVDRAQFVAVAGPSRHHMGTTRMHKDPAKGVVDPNSRVHGLSNLYVAGSSVFPTSGIGNPTLTLVAMTMRLCDHLKRAA